MRSSTLSLSPNPEDALPVDALLVYVLQVRKYLRLKQVLHWCVSRYLVLCRFRPVLGLSTPFVNLPRRVLGDALYHRDASHSAASMAPETDLDGEIATLKARGNHVKNYSPWFLTQEIKT